MKGSYILLVHLEKDRVIKIGKLGNISFKKGYYVYIGSAMNSIEKRTQRHLKDNKKYHWHIDYFLEYVKIQNVYLKTSNIKQECVIAKKFDKSFNGILNFGCSDCRCKSHLFFGDKKDFKKLIDNLGFRLLKN